jgi:tetratricopeptide (TPR) repeat protein
MKNADDLLNTTICPEDKTLQDYAFNKLLLEEKRRVELHLADCEMCNDMIEGMQNLGEKNFETTLKNLQTKVDEESKVKIIPFWGWKKMLSLAAGLALVFVVSRVIFMQLEQEKSKEIAMVESKEKTEAQNPPLESSSEMDTTLVATNNNNEVLEEIQTAKTVVLKESENNFAFNNKLENKENVLKEEVTQSDNTTKSLNLNDDIVAVTGIAAPVPQQEDIAIESASKRANTDAAIFQTEDDDKGVSLSEIVVSSKGNKRNKKSNSKVAEKKMKNKSDSRSDQTFSQTEINRPAVVSYPKLHARVPLQFMKNGDYKNSLAFAEDLLHLEPNNDTAQFIIGFSLMKLNRIEEAKAMLTKVSVNADSPYIREAMFELALLKKAAGDESYKQTMKALAGGRDTTALKARGYK